MSTSNWAARVVVFDRGSLPYRKGVFLGTLNWLPNTAFPALAAAFDIGRRLSVSEIRIEPRVDALAEFPRSHPILTAEVKTRLASTTRDRSATPRPGG